MKNLTIILSLILLATLFIGCDSSIDGNYRVDIELPDNHKNSKDAKLIAVMDISMVLKKDGTGFISMKFKDFDVEESDELRYRVADQNKIYISIDGGAEEIYYQQPDGRLVNVDEEGIRTILIKRRW